MRPTAGPLPTTSASIGSTAGLPAGISVATINGKQIFVLNGRQTLYDFDKDHDNGQNNLSHCPYATVNPQCTIHWVPVTPPVGTLPANWESFTRKIGCGTTAPECLDGLPQLSYKGWPLYTFYLDTKLGDTNGDGLTIDGGYPWHVVGPTITVRQFP
jgi:predicted lipoprotein with Yx(FWY)xxD motif